MAPMPPPPTPDVDAYAHRTEGRSRSALPPPPPPVLLHRGATPVVDECVRRLRRLRHHRPSLLPYELDDHVRNYGGIETFLQRQHCLAQLCDGHAEAQFVRVVIHPMGGIGNRVYQLLSGLLFAALYDRLLLVDWPSAQLHTQNAHTHERILNVPVEDLIDTRRYFPALCFSYPNASARFATLLATGTKFAINFAAVAHAITDSDRATAAHVWTIDSDVTYYGPRLYARASHAAAVAALLQPTHGGAA
eukprot:CAMPEP_0198327138 /NCGR_PEP_ID=MMETSP1450-20131203/14483_1 /TAXON_ID=753684 ORGANISM="Madagascaria erythrocladiodes, Strain CCMP3234" /NCGR_SAMPLE_ID=MMETSP1450 /ASSEMBLY_ACC=CAM_ASM_001115 /LENGTH=247 /DNA_ID=CAMNT_0044031163 /DNA_START=1 /DNA_END=741 /DNA_ORIENTATION=+